MPLDLDSSNRPQDLDHDLSAAIADLLSLDQAEVKENSDLTFAELGGNSVQALELTFKLDAAGKSIDVETILGHENSILSLSEGLQQPSQKRPESPKLNGHAVEDDSDQDQEPDGEAEGKRFFEEACQQLRCSVADIEHVLPLTSQQRGLWLGSLQVEGVYLSQWQYQITPEIDLNRLARAWRIALKSHPILRTRVLSLSDSKFHQVILSPEFYDARDDLLHQDSIIAEEGAPLFGISIDSRGQSRILRIFCHHVLYDRWSMGLILQDVQYVYQHDDTPPLRPPYLSFVHLLEEKNVDTLQVMWRDGFGLEPVTPAPRVTLSEKFALASELIEESAFIPSLGHTTVAEAITAAWSFVCSKHCGLPRVSFGLTVSGRHVPLSGVSKMAFPTFNTVPFIADISDEDTVADFLAMIKSRMACLRQIQHVDVGAISDIDPSGRDACRFNSLLVIQQNMSTTEEPADSLFGSKNFISFETQQSAPLVLECNPKENEVRFTMKYDPTYVIPTDAKSMLSHLTATFQRMSFKSDERLTSLNIFGDYDLELVKKWVSPNLPLERTTLHAMVEEAAKVRPDATAIWQTAGSLTYGDLIEQSRNVMKKILSRDSDCSPNIGVCLEKSAHAIVAMLGVSMSGHTFVPIDASNPFDRIMQLVENAQINLLLCSQSTAPRFEKTDVKVMIIDKTTCSESQTPNISSSASSDPEKVVYIIYTSGSTGEPKGVVLTQQALCTTLKAISKHLEFSTDTRSLQFSSFAFDMSVHDIWCTFLGGGVVCVPTEAERFELGDFISRSNCNYAMLTPSVALTLSDREWSMFDKLSVSGEPLQKAVIRGALHGGVKFWNTYGPTESCVICMTEQINTLDTSPLKLGHSFAANSWIIDADDPHRLAPVGCLGELALSGHTLALGYYHDLQKTKRAFVAGLEWTKQFPNHHLDRVYRTGDLARYNSDGSIEFGGRLGGYIKIAGNRVDLGEIEETLHNKCNLPKVSVQYCPVGNVDARDMLISFCAIPGAIQSDELLSLPMTKELEAKVFRAFSKLKEVLPSYMIPVAFVPVNRLPYGTAGKLDKGRLFSLVTNAGVDEVLAIYGINTQIGEREQEIAEDNDMSSEATLLRDSWATVLKIKSNTISSQSNFFSLGGDSLRALKLGANLRQSGHSISVADIFKFPRLNKMADRIKQVSNGGPKTTSNEIWSSEETKRILAQATKLLQLSEGQIECVLPCTPLQIQMLASSAQSPSTYLHRECFRLTSDVTTTELKDVFQHLSATNELLRAKVVIDEKTGQFILVVLDPSSPILFTHHRGDIQSYINSDQTPLGVERDLNRFVLLESDQERVLLWEIHHSIYDGYSMVLLMRQIRDGILRCRQQSRESGVAASLPTPKFEDFVRFINQADQQEATGFWSEYLQDAPRLDLPFEKPAGHGRDPSENKTITRQLTFDARQSAVTTAVYIRTAFAITLSQYTTNTDIVFSATNNGRDLPIRGVEDLAAPTFSTLPVRCIIDKDETLGAMLSRVQLEAADISSYQYLSPEKIGSINANCKQACRVLVHLLVQSAANETPVKELEDLGYSVMPDTSKMNLPIPFSLVATPKKTSITFEIIYKDALFSSQQIDLFLDQFLANMNQILTAEDTVSVRDIYGLGKANGNAYLDIQPETEDRDKFGGLNIPDLVFKGLDTRAKDQALYSTTSSFTYGEIFEHASALAEDIIRRVDSKHRYVAVCFEKSPWAIIAQLAVMIAGHAYVSIDESWPTARKQVVLSQIDCPLLIVSTRMSQNLPDMSIQVMAFDGSGSMTSDSSSKPLNSRTRSEDAAYVVFTSGSTGTPKGVVVQHEAICRTASTYAERLYFTRNTRSLLFASFSFDASIMETWAILIAGGTLCIADDKERISDLAAFIVRSQSDFVALTPTGAKLLDPNQTTCIKTLLFCGEKCQPKDLEGWARSDLTLVNGYGPSETAVNAVMNTRFSSDDLNNIGLSMGGGLWVVNPYDHNELVPVGGIGELLVVGPVLAKEYIKNTEKTSQKFVQPKWPSWTQASGQRAYKTGDLVQLGADGSLRFVGRHDGQMKINGVRIEAEEIESAIHQSDIDVDGAAVGTYAVAEAAHELVVFFVPPEQAQKTHVNILPLHRSHEQIITRLHEHLSETLPHTHVPNMYVPVRAIPRTNTDKTDRKWLSQALEQLHHAQISLYRRMYHNEANNSTSDMATADQSTPKGNLNPTEEALSLLWAQVLPQRKSNTRLNHRSHFIQAGGDSVSAIKMSSLARSKGMDLPVSAIYANPALADMAATLDKKGDPTNNKEADPMSALSDLASPSPFEMLDIDLISPLASKAGLKGRKAQTDYFSSSSL